MLYENATSDSYCALIRNHEELEPYNLLRI